jgi:hypothetical protein
MENSDKKALAFGLGAVAVGAGIAVLVSQKAKASPSPTTATLLVTVTDSETGLPISGAQVSVAGLSLNTNTSGQCIFTDLPFTDPNEITIVTIMMGGYTTMQQSINLTAGMNTLGIQLVPTAPTPPPPAATASLTVTVTDSVTGQPVSGAQVSIAGMALNTNSVGQCIFTGIPVGQYEITVTMAGYL